MKHRLLAPHYFGLLALAIPSTDAGARRRGIMGKKAPEVWASAWRNLPKGAKTYSVHGNRGRVICLFFFQSWCPGCHSRGFPTLASLSKHYSSQPDVTFAAIQTVFEGFGVNTPAKAWSSMREFGLNLPIGHDSGPRGRRSATMGRYRSGGTPWLVIIDRAGIVRFDGFHIAPARAQKLIDRLLSAPPISMP